ncbi:hypothetical protein DENSPDRAFT_845806 [Dentipellis sp. KUC8613]|nr:hypothetical protein DENSPDRAFT_845806 [Dentipellis sp. KUC8613]
MKATVILLPLALLVSAANGIRVDFFTRRSCVGGESHSFNDVACGRCFSPAGDWGAVQYSGLTSSSRVVAYHQAGCSPSTEAASAFGNTCFIQPQGAIPFRSAFVACPGPREE